jgi:microcystin-dependent protein
MGIATFSQQTVNTGIAGSVPAGVISQFAGATAPNGYLLCTGQQVAISDHSELYEVLGTTYGALTNGSGGAGSTHFRIPNLQGRIPVGRDSAQTEFDALGETSGEKTVTLSTANMAPHTHTGTTGTQSANHSHSGSTGTVSSDHSHSQSPSANPQGLAGFGAGFGGQDYWARSADTSYNRSYNTGGISANHTHSFSTGTESANHTHSFTTGNGTGTSTPVNNLQTYIVVNYIINT